MATPNRELVNDGIYHVYNRGVEKRIIFRSNRDYQRFFETLLYYQQPTKVTKRFTRADMVLSARQRPFRFELLAYCLMPNHFHLLVRQVFEDGISSAMAQLSNSYTKYFNTKYQRVGHLFQGRFQSVPVVNDEQLVHVVRYILLNPYVAGLTTDPLQYRYSSIGETVQGKEGWCDKSQFQNFFRNSDAIRVFITDYADEARNRQLITKHLVIDS